MAKLVSVNVAVVRPGGDGPHGVTGIDKQPAPGPVPIEVPRPGASGVAGDRIGNGSVHGGEDQAVYAYAREDLDHWAAELDRPLPGGTFGENLTTAGLAVTDALIGERWRIGDEVVLEVTVPRLPCTTFATWMGERKWVRRFTAAAMPGAYLRVLSPGTVRGGDRVEVVHRPPHDVSIGVTFRALTIEPELLPRLVHIEELPADVRALAARRTATSADR